MSFSVASTYCRFALHCRHLVIKLKVNGRLLQCCHLVIKFGPIKREKLVELYIFRSWKVVQFKMSTSVRTVLTVDRNSGSRTTSIARNCCSRYKPSTAKREARLTRSTTRPFLVSVTDTRGRTDNNTAFIYIALYP